MKYLLLTIAVFATSLVGLQITQATVADLNSCDDIATMGAVFYDMAHEEGMTEEYYREVVEYNVENGLEVGSDSQRVILFKDISEVIWQGRDHDRDELLKGLYDASERGNQYVRT